MRRVLGTNGLSVVFLAFFALALGGQALAGWQDFNNEAAAHGEASVSLGRYLVSSSLGNAVLENWQSEYLQFTLYILLTVWLVQRGSPESKQPGQGVDAAELAVGVPGRRLDGRLLDLPAPARLAGVQAGGSTALGDGHRGLGARPPA